MGEIFSDRFDVFIVNFVQISHIVLAFPSLALNKLLPAGFYCLLDSRLFHYVDSGPSHSKSHL